MTTEAAPVHLSKSQLGTLSTCALQYQRKYIFKERGEPMPAKVGAGVGMHAAFARYFNCKRMGQTLPTVLDMLAVADAEWREFGEKQGGLRWEDPPNDEQNLKADLLQAITAFDSKVGPLIKPWGVEVPAKITLKYPDLEQPVESYIDLVGDDEQHTIYDWKFSQRYTERVEAGNDHVLYSLWASEKFGIPNTPFKTVQFVRYKKGLEIRGLEDDQAFLVTPADREWHLKHVVYEAIRLKNAGIYMANVANCNWCAFKSTCRPTV
ncbi:RecB family exonuclease [Glutamicibacter sp.]|jgi:hypothetical protein|uniref:RecB family exonuclease n=1 Tax=Glutamicibacter sp. TaxID=1931995 RepID=UPI002FDAD246